MADEKPTPPPEPEPERPRPITPSPGTHQTHGDDRPSETKIMIQQHDGEIRHG